MSYYKGDAGDRVSEFWRQSPENRKVLVEWMAANKLGGGISLTVFARLGLFEAERQAFLKAQGIPLKSPGGKKKSGARSKKGNTP